MRARRVRTTHFALLDPEGVVQHSPGSPLRRTLGFCFTPKGSYSTAQGRRFGAPWVLLLDPQTGRTAQPRVAASAHPGFHGPPRINPERVVQLGCPTLSGLKIHSSRH